MTGGRASGPTNHAAKFTDKQIAIFPLQAYQIPKSNHPRKMPRLHGYLEDRGYYIKHSFLADRKIHYVVYQVSPEAEEVLTQQGLKDGDFLPDDLFCSLRETGKIFTNRQGVEGTPLVSASSAVSYLSSTAKTVKRQCVPASVIRKELKRQNPTWTAKELRRSVNESLAGQSDTSVTANAAATHAAFEKLSAAARTWVGLRVASHPSARIVNSRQGPDGELHYAIEGVPELFLEQLLRVAAMQDGTDFFESLDQSYQTNRGSGNQGISGKAT